MSGDSTSIHEASHALVGHLLGEHVRSLAVLGDQCGWTMSGVPADGDRQNRMVTLLAGRAAERAAGFEVDRRPSQDERKARGIALELAGWPGSGDVGLETAEWILVHAERRTATMVAANRDAIASVAAALRANAGRLGGGEVLTALKAALSLDRPVTRITMSPLERAFVQLPMALTLRNWQASHWRLLGLQWGDDGTQRGRRSGARIITNRAG